jgi:hypothetical protein
MIEMSLATKCANADFQKIFARKGYAFFTKGEYNLNIIGVRHKGAKVTNHFDDCLVVIYNTPNEQNVKRVFVCTTLPGKKAMEHPTAIKGTAILKEGQYRGAYQIGYHKGKYKALCQKKPLIVYRDNNKDQVYDLSPISIDRGIFGINIHKAGDNSTLVDGWSYGCTVLAKSIDFNALMRLVEKSANIYGNSFTYTLINEEDLT